MTRGTPWILPALAVALLAGCGRMASPADIAAQACEAQVRIQLGSQPYHLDLQALAASMADDDRGGLLLTAKVTVNAGLADQAVQDLECTVRMNAEQTAAEVLTMRFIW